mmetsp:Transcript_2852/g.5408  ORF Transcript_2852/g.5408 Transcript_2852/m.5408 type:complete len:219 (-) Transcript_2852:196-852(-)
MEPLQDSNHNNVHKVGYRRKLSRLFSPTSLFPYATLHLQYSSAHHCFPMDCHRHFNLKQNIQHDITWLGWTLLVLTLLSFTLPCLYSNSLPSDHRLRHPMLVSSKREFLDLSLRRASVCVHDDHDVHVHAHGRAHDHVHVHDVHGCVPCVHENANDPRISRRYTCDHRDCVHVHARDCDPLRRVLTYRAHDPMCIYHGHDSAHEGLDLPTFESVLPIP